MVNLKTDSKKKIMNLMNKLNIDNININDSFIKIDINDLFYYGLSGHYSPKGYEHLAEIVDQHLRENYGN